MVYTEADDVPQWAIGKTADEVLDMTKTLYTAVVNNNPQVQYNTPTASPQAPLQPTQTSSGPPDTALLYNKPEEYQRQLNAWQHNSTQAAISTIATPYLGSITELAKAESKRSVEFEEVWQRYAPEIEAEVAHLPIQMKTSVRLWNDAAALIKGRKSEIIFKDRLAKLRPEDSGTFSGGAPVRGGSSHSGLSPVEKAWVENAPWVQQFKRLPGMSLHKLRDQVHRMGHKEDEYVKHYENKNAMNIHPPSIDAELAHYGVR